MSLPAILDRHPDELLTSRQVAEVFGVSSRTLARWSQNGRLPETHTTLGGQRRYRWSDITPVLAAHSPAGRHAANSGA
ncbi:MAG: helix-turn-helix domain-containing protein [Acidimicrobiia bacterium]